MIRNKGINSQFKTEIKPMPKNKKKKIKDGKLRVSLFKSFKNLIK